MKIKKFELIKEDIKQKLYLIINHDHFDYYSLFDNKKDISNFIMNVLYDRFQGNDRILDSLDEFIAEDFTIEELADYYNEFQDNYGNLNKFTFEEVNLLNNVKLKDWVNLRIKQKNYNL